MEMALDVPVPYGGQGGLSSKVIHIWGVGGNQADLGSLRSSSSTHKLLHLHGVTSPL